MAKKTSKPRPKRQPIRLGPVNTVAIADRLRELHELGEDREVAQFPASDEVFLVLLYTARRAAELKQPANVVVNVVGEAAVLRAKLWQYLREQADAGQLKAIEQGRAAGVPWHHFNEALCVTSKQGAYQKARRLKAEEVREPHERRSPEVAREHEDRALAEKRAERTRVIAQEQRFPLALRIGRLLVENKDDFVVASMSEYWLSEITARSTIARPPGASQLQHVHRELRPRDSPARPEPQPARHHHRRGPSRAHARH